MERTIRRSHALGLRSVALVLVGLGVAAACSDDSSSPGETPPGGGGEGGEGPSTSGSGGSSAGKAGSPSNGGALSMSGAPGEAGQSGHGVVEPMPTLGEQCTTCGNAKCEAELKGCSDSAACSDWLSCLTACDSTECVAACDDTHADAARVYAGVYDCLCTSCKDDCAGADACGKKTCVDDHPLALMPTAPATLAETGLYELVDDGAGGAGGAGGAASVELAMPIQIAAYAHGFEPKYPLWADSATKARYGYIPKCATIDTSDMDHWKFPVGTTFWKTFTVGNAMIETRMLHRFGAGALDWTYAAYQWPKDTLGGVNAMPDPTKATLVPDVGVQNANATTHDIPSVGQCKQCHNGLPEKVLGFGAIQLSHMANAGEVDIETISNLGWLSVPAPDGFNVPGTPVQQAALGYMHGNCGGCHSEITPTPAGDPQLLRLMVAETNYATNKAVTSTVGVVVQSQNGLYKGKQRIAPMDPDNSVILMRMGSRTPGQQMPPLGTEVVDTDGGMKAVTDWINSIPKN